jgi:hypothetical protein
LEFDQSILLLSILESSRQLFDSVLSETDPNNMFHWFPVIADPDNYKTTTLAAAGQYDYMIMTQHYDESCEPICAMDMLTKFKID